MVFSFLETTTSSINSLDSNIFFKCLLIAGTPTPKSLAIDFCESQIVSDSISISKTTSWLSNTGYAKHRKDAIKLLEDYHANPYDTEKNYSFIEVFNAVFDEFVAHKSHSSELAYNATYVAFKPLYNMMFKDIKTVSLQKIFDKSDKNYPTLRKMKVTINQMYKHAMKYDICSKDYTDYIELSKHRNKNPDSRAKLPFTNKQIDELWDFADNQYY